MADTLEQIFMSTNLGATQLDDGEHTILTTDANTSYVVKDMNTINTSSLNSTYLELNGFNVGTVASNATGSLIIPPSSTLKIKSTNYPYSFNTIETYAIGPTTGAYYDKAVTVVGTDTTAMLKEAVTSNTIPRDTTTIDMLFDEYNGNDYFYMTSHDGNSSQQARWSSTTSNGADIFSLSYAGHGLSNDTSRGVCAIVTSSSTVRLYDFNSGPTTSYTDIRSGLSPHPTTSYPRGKYFGGYLWYIPSSAYTSQMYGVNIVTGKMVAFSGLPSASTAGSSEMQFCVSLDPVDDKFIFWRPNSNRSQMSVSKSNTTRTSLLANTSDATSLSSTTLASSGTLPALIAGGGHDSTVLTPQADGSISYQNADGVYTNIDTSLSVTSTSPELDLSAITVAGNEMDVRNRFFKRTSSTSTAADITASGISVPTFGIQLLGIKSET